MGNEHCQNWLRQGKNATSCFYSHGQRRLSTLSGWNHRAKYPLEKTCTANAGKRLLKQWTIWRCRFPTCVNSFHDSDNLAGYAFAEKKITNRLPGWFLLLIFGIILGINNEMKDQKTENGFQEVPIKIHNIKKYMKFRFKMCMFPCIDLPCTVNNRHK